jgi:ribose-phosphate pyrophosphokinase
VASIAGNEEEGLTVNDALMELLVMIHAAKHASAHRIIAVTPWYGYSRQDKKSAPREPITARLVAELLEVAGIDRLVTMDLHAGQMQGFFSKPVDHMTAMPILTQFLQDQFATEDIVIIAPDAGRVKLVQKFSQKIGAPYALLEKERPAHQVAEIGYVIGDVKGKVAVIVDDIIDTGGTLSAAAQTVLDEGAEKVFAVATHAVFSGNAYKTLGASPLSGIVVTDTIPLRDGAPDHVQVLTTADILTDSIRRIFTDDSVSEIFAGENQLF